MPFFTPDRIYGRFSELDPAALYAEGIRVLLLDMDNTLIPYEESEPNEEVLAFLSSLKAHGIAAALVTNNHKKRLKKFNAALGLPAYANSLKPLPHNLLRAMRKLGAGRKETALLGDQLLTDMFAARFAGIRSFIVSPINDKKTWIVRMKRKIERPLVRRYYKRIEKQKETKHD